VKSFHDTQEQPPCGPTAEQLKRVQLITLACDILFNSICPKEFNQINCLDNTKEIWDTLVEIREGTSSVKEFMLDILTGQLDKFRMKHEEGVNKNVLKTLYHRQ
jgi:hypothetical protein